MIGFNQAAWRDMGGSARRFRYSVGLIAIAAMALLVPSAAQAVTLTVVGPDGTPAGGYRWLVEEDATYDVVPGVTCAPGDPVANCPGANFHKSYMPVLAKGHSGIAADDAKLAALSTSKRYFISVLPDAGFANGGTRVALGQTAAQVLVQPTPLPTAQIRVLAYNDNFPINNAPDTPEEVGIEGFDVLLFEAGGTYGQSGGQVTQDCFGNPLGTTYNPGDTTPITIGNGHFKTDADGVVVIKYLCPAKYTIQIVPPAGQGWIQTHTLEGTKGIDAWVKPNEPTFFAEFGPPGPHVSIGFVQQFKDTAVLSGGHSIRGQVRNLHQSRPPDFTQFSGDPVPGCWVGLNEGALGTGRGLYAAPCNADSTFEITGVPNGDYGLAIWDASLDRIFATNLVKVAGADVDFLDVPVFDWFAHYQGSVFNDINRNGFRECVTPACDNTSAGDEIGIPDAALNIRFRDGSIYQSSSTDPQGKYEFREVFPFFNWMVAEVDFATKQATGATVVVDGGGPVSSDQGWTYPSSDKLNPQQQCASFDTAGNCVGPLNNPFTGNNLSRTEPGWVLLEGMQAFLGQTHVIDWGKANYPAGHNGGITGIVHYATTRAENNPQYAAAENWEPGIPRVQFNLYKDANRDGVIDKLATTSTAKACSNNPAITCTTDAPCDPGGGLPIGKCGGIRADVDNPPFDWRVCSNDLTVTCVSNTECPGGTCGTIAAGRGPEDIDWNGNGVFDAGDALNVTATDAWDDSLPVGCQGDTPFSVNGVQLDCYDGLRNFGQVRPVVFDGGYAFTSYFPGGIASGSTAVEDPDATTLPSGTYIVEGVTPPGYDLVREEDKNVDFGPEATPSPLLIPAACFGDQHLLPQFLTLFPGVENPSNFPFVPTKRAPLCDRKQVTVRQGQNAAADFFLFTEAPVAGHISGFILNDFANEFDPNAPTFGEKYSPPFLPVSIRDWTGREISRVYSDRWGNYNALVPSTYWISAPFPSGVSPSMMTACMNSPGPIANPAYNPNDRRCSGNPTQVCTSDAECSVDQTCVARSSQFIADPQFDRRYSQFCYTFQYMPGKTTYLDTPVQPIAAFAGPAQFPVDCEWQSGTPVIYSVYGSQGGPYVPVKGQNITIVSAGQVAVPNPAYDEVAQPKTILRDFGFGATRSGGNVNFAGRNLPIVSWNNNVIVATIPATGREEASRIGQLTVTRGNGTRTETGVTLYVGPLIGPASNPTPVVRHVRPSPTGWPDRPIQAAIDVAGEGDLILVAPGTYEENVIMWKPVRLQGWGAASTLINAAKVPAERLQWWRDRTRELITAGSVDLLPSQEIGFAQPEPATLFTEECPGIIVLSKDGAFVSTPNARIDGMGVTGADHGGGIFVNGYARFLEISNNRVFSNQGVYGGGIRIGHPLLTVQTVDGLDYEDCQNDSVSIRSNQVIQNGSSDGAGGGISLNHGSNLYRVSDNFVCGNFTGGDGAGIGHYGLSTNGKIARNKIYFNEAFNQGRPAGGGGISVSGAPPLPLNTSTLTPGSGSVQIFNNLIQGNNAGAGDGGGIRVASVSGRDIERNPSSTASWHHVEIDNNIIIDNVAGMAGGGLSLQDAPRVSLLFNTIVNNDSTATVGAAFAPGSPNQSTPQVAGIVSRAHTQALANTFGAGVTAYDEFSNPLLRNNIIRNNRSFFFTIDRNAIPPVFELSPDVGALEPAVIWDLSVEGTTTQRFMDPGSCVLSANWQDPDSNPWNDPTAGTSPYSASNFAADPAFTAEYFNGNRRQSIQQPELTSSVAVAPAFDEGGNWITVRFGPLTTLETLVPQTLYADAHIGSCSPAANLADASVLPATCPATMNLLSTNPRCFDYDVERRFNNLPADVGADEKTATCFAALPPVFSPPAPRPKSGLSGGISGVEPTSAAVKGAK